MSALTLATINGDVAMVNDGSLQLGGFVEFTLSASDVDTGSNAVVSAIPIAVALPANGEFSVSLWPNASGPGSTSYSVRYVRNSTEVLLGTMTVPGSGTYRLEDLIGA